SSGLGKAAVQLFAQKGWNVIATMRKPEKEIELGNDENIILLPLDVTDSSQVKSTVAKAIEKAKIDVVFNNAGYGLAGPFEGATDEQISQQMNTNLLGVMRVTREFLPHFRENKSGIFITTTSIGGLVTLPFNSVYHATKWALEGWSESLAFELKEFGITVKTVSPGGITTNFAGPSLVLTDHKAYGKQMQQVFSVFMDPERAMLYSTAMQIAEVVYEAATDGKSTLRYVAGEDAKEMYAQRLKLGDEEYRKAVAETFYRE
ncbi:MAG: NAD(P)-dependent dehydrogenase (short-subunit alcohol dehydrogenase family), partial [Bacteroidia bacterium]